jgi:hypothetical protein
MSRAQLDGRSRMRGNLLGIEGAIAEILLGLFEVSKHRGQVNLP